MSLRAYAQLVRLPNLPSALADICLGALVMQALPPRWLPFGLLLLASACLYCAGMAWNDYFDVEQDRRERPGRPIPSGQVTLGQAARLGTGLLAAGVILALLAGWSQQLFDGSAQLAPGLLALVLVGTILLYDGPLKHTWAGPAAMGSCRLLNVLLGVATAGAAADWPRGLYLAVVVGLYIAGVTWFARTEARLSNRLALQGAAALMLASLLLALPLPVFVAVDASSVLFPYLLVLFGFGLGFPVCRAIARPTPTNVQDAVKRSLMGLIVYDAILASSQAGTLGLSILVLLAPSLYLNRRAWLYAT